MSSIETRPKKPYPKYLGGLAATFAASCTHPLDLTKVRLQASGDKRMVASMTKTVKAGGFLALFDGITGTWLRQMSYSMCRFWAYEEFKTIVGVKGKDAPAWKLALAGSMAGGIAGFVGNPGDIVMVRMQGDAAKPPGSRFNYRHALDGLFRMVREEGTSSLLRGVGPNVTRAILMNASQLASYDFAKAELLKTPYFEDNMICHFTSAFISGTVATTVCSPADVLKNRIMNSSGESSVLTVIRNSLKNEGPMFVFKGWLPAWIRQQPYTILIFVTLEQLKRGVDWARLKGVSWM